MAKEFYRYLDCALGISTANACGVLDGLSSSKRCEANYVEWVLEDGSIVRRDHKGDGFYTPASI